MQSLLIETKTFINAFKVDVSCFNVAQIVENKAWFSVLFSLCCNIDTEATVIKASELFLEHGEVVSPSLRVRTENELYCSTKNTTSTQQVCNKNAYQADVSYTLLPTLHSASEAFLDNMEERKDFHLKQINRRKQFNKDKKKILGMWVPRRRLGNI